MMIIFQLLPYLVALIVLITSAATSSHYHEQEGVYDGREHILGQIWQVKDPECLDLLEKLGQLVVVDRVFPPQFMAQFLQALLWETMPGNTTSELALPTEDEIVLGVTSYSEWAPSPYNKLPGNAFDQVQMRIASHEDTTGLQVVDKRLHAMKVRLWEDVIPLTGNQWQRKRLNDAENFDMACEYLVAVVDVFAYLNYDNVQASLKGVFNNIANEWKDFEDAVNAIREHNDKPSISMVSLWEEYVRRRWSILTTRSHDWVIAHVDGLRANLLDELHRHEPPTFDTFSTEQWNITNKLHTLAEIAARAGYTIILPMTGYIGHETTEYEEQVAFSTDIATRAEEYSLWLKLTTRQRMAFDTIYTKINGIDSTNRGIADPVILTDNYVIQKEEQESLRRVFAAHATVKLGAEEWILTMKQFIDSQVYGVNKWGFVIYRLTYQQSEEEWSQFMEKLQADVDDWGDGIVGADLILETAQLRWIDGRDVGIKEGDYEAATRHFLDLASEEGFQDKSDWDEGIFLYVDAASVTSYIQPLEDPDGDLLPHGDFGGFVTAVDAPFDPNNPGEHAEESPGFTGRMRISGNLLWSDLFSLGKAQAASAEDLWPLAMEHPWQVYVGPVSSRQQHLWGTTWQKFKDNGVFQKLLSPVGKSSIELT